MVPDIFWLMPTYSLKKHNLCVAATIEDDVMRIDDDDETPKVEQIATFFDLSCCIVSWFIEM